MRLAYWLDSEGIEGNHSQGVVDVKDMEAGFRKIFDFEEDEPTPMWSEIYTQCGDDWSMLYLDGAGLAFVFNIDAYIGGQILGGLKSV